MMLCTECGQSFLANDGEFAGDDSVCSECLDELRNEAKELLENLSNNYDANNGTEGGECSPP